MTARRMREAAAQEAYRSAGRFDTPDRIRALPLPDEEGMAWTMAETMCRAAGFSPNEPVYGTGTAHGGVVVLRYKIHDFIPLARAAIRAINWGEP